MSIAKENLTEFLTSDEFALLSEKLDASIQSKITSGELTFSSKDADPNPSTIDLSQFGLHNPEDIKIFLLSPAGETVIHEIGSELAHERAIEEERQLQIQEDILMEERKKGFLFHLLLSEEAEAQKAQNELIEMQQEKALKPSEQTPQKKKTSEQNSALKDTLEGYDSSIRSYQEQQKNLKTQEKALNEELNRLEEESLAIEAKHTTYNNVLNAYDKSAPTFEKNPEMLDREISSLERQIDRLTEHVFEELDKGNEKEARKILDQQNALNLQLASLKDIKSKVGNEKVFFDADLNSEGVTYDKALFALPKDQAPGLVKHNGEFYLLNKGEKWDDVKNDSFKLAEAQARFENAKPEIMSVKNVVQHVKKQEVEQNASRKDETRSKLVVNKAEQLMVKNHITSMQAARANAKQALTSSPDLAMQPPGSTITGASYGLGATSTPTDTQSKISSTPTASPQPVFNAAAFVQTISNEPKPTWGFMFSKVKTIQDPRAQKEVDKFLTDEAKKNLPEDKKNELDKFNPEALKRKLMGMLERAPVPEVAMNSFLKHMAKFEEAYKPNVTSEESPVAQRDQTQPLSPFNTTPST
ncbi:hypothetical protein [Legionella sp. PC997]|uniref:hypothetical protein n=1 Tax=Legionella sp. PC997 TaxID=2755562 RepID=UPI0015FA06A9|nr:hypothetical protein [Legionella sp. PC997]QMT60710.1 hypothetical protein HBNCFIEN_02094 [Legionella sp. PC997]